MQTTPHFTPTQNRSIHDAPFQENLATSLPADKNNTMYFDVPHHGAHSTTSSGATTPISGRSSVSTESSASSISGTSGQLRSSLKSSLKSNPASEANGASSKRRSSPSSVRFAEPEQPTRPKSLAPRYQPRKCQSYNNAVPNPLLQYQRRSTSLMPSSASPSRSSVQAGPQTYLTLPPHIVPTPHQGQFQYKKARPSQRFSAPVRPTQPGPKRLSTRPSADFTSPSLALEHRVSSFQSVSSVQSAPAEIQTPLAPALPGPYDPLENHVPCLYEGCTGHFSPTTLGSTYYIPQGPYSLSRLHGYCPQHATKDLREANAWCKRNWESLRQNAGRKTLGEIASEFDGFLETFRMNRRGEDVELLQRQGRIIVGFEGSKYESEWRWEYTPRNCTRESCSSARYSPFANHLFAFYHTRRALTFYPLPTLCPPCARNEVEAFERLVSEKWGSRTGWQEAEWEAWFGEVAEEREGAKTFWEGAQGKEVREWKAGKGLGQGTGMEKMVKQKKVEKGQKMVKAKKIEEVAKKDEEKSAGKRKSILKRLFGRE